MLLLGKEQDLSSCLQWAVQGPNHLFWIAQYLQPKVCTLALMRWMLEWGVQVGVHIPTISAMALTYQSCIWYFRF